MSSRGRGRGRGRERGRGRDGGGGGGRGGGGRGQHHYDQPSPWYSSGRGRGGDGRGGGYQTPPPPSSSQFPSLSSPASASASSSSSSYPSQEMQQKLTLQPSSSVAVPETVTLQQPSVIGVPEQQVVQVQEQSVQEPVMQLPPASSKAMRLPSRPGYGTLGKKCVVRANHFLVQVAERDLHHYDVSITPEVTSKKVCRDIINNFVELYCESQLGKRMLAYDGRKSAYTAGPLPFSSKELPVKLVDKDNEARKDREFKVSIKFAAKADFHHLQQFLQGRQHDSPQETIQVLDVVLRATPSINNTVVGRSLFSAKMGRGELADGLEYWKGFYQSLRPTQMGLSLNIDTSARGFFEPILVTDFVAKYFNVNNLQRPLSDQDRFKVKRALKGVKVEVTHSGYLKRYKITGVTVPPLSQLTFPVDDTGRDMPVVQYFRQRYNIILKYTFLPALLAGSDAKPVYLPMEISKIVEGQRYMKKLNEKQVSALLKATCQRPEDREKSIKKMVDYNNYNNDKLSNKEFGIQVRSELMTINARVLPPPTLKYHDTGREARVEPRVGQWNMIDKKMVDGGKVDYWTCVNFSRARMNLDQFCYDLIYMCRSKGMEFSEPLLPIQSAHSGQIERALRNIHAQVAAELARIGQGGKTLQLLIIILPDVSGSYGMIKRVCETELGIVSQCCQPRQAQKNNKQYLENVALKINVKVGGKNTVLLNADERKIHMVSDRPTIIFGADVTHPSPGEDSSPSIAAVVASVDWPLVTKYRGLVSAQAHKEEIIQDLYKTYQDPQRGTVHGGMIRDSLMAFYRSCQQQKPHRIIFYRDGVSEGQFNQVLLDEVDAIRKACGSLEGNYQPRITFVVVQKRHHTRLFAADHRNRSLTDRSGNILPGTVVDTQICHPTEFDFYLCSHAGIQGTSRPAHYHVLYDENNFSADSLQTLTNNLCYTYARCTRSVSIVPPAYYAHLLAFRAREYIKGDVSEGESTGGRTTTRERTKEVQPLPAIKDSVKEVMFYC